jgi:hypothetical protein
MKSSAKFAALDSESARLTIQFAIGVIAIGLIFWWLQFSTSAICCGDFDGYYHAKWSRIVWESIRNRSFPPAFPWLPLTTLNPHDYVDHHLLFHILQIPFTRFRDLRLGTKVGSVVFATLAVASCYWLLVRYRIRYLLVWLVALLACSAPFLYRLNMAKAPPFAIIYLIIGIYLLFTKKYWPLVPLAFIFTLTYDTFVLLILAALIWVIVIAWTERRFEWRPFAWVAAGTAAGLIINPYFPHNLHLLFEHLKIKLTASDFSTKVGSEWYPYDSWEFLVNSIVACVAMVVGYLAFEPGERKRSHYSFFFLLFSTALLMMAARWRRFAEYWPPFAVLFSAFSLQPWLDGTRSVFTRLPPDMLEELMPFLDREGDPVLPNETEQQEVGRILAVAGVAVVLAVVLFFNLWVTVRDIASSEPDDYYKAGADWMRANIPPKQIVFNTDWDDFPRLFYYDETHYYVSGLDPTYLFDKNPDLSRLYERITLGKEEDPGPLIRDRFGARYVFTDNSHHDFFTNATESGWFEIVFEDPQCTIMHIRDEKAVAPGEKPEPALDVPPDENNPVNPEQ